MKISFHRSEAENMEHCLLERHLQRIKFAMKSDTLTLAGPSLNKMFEKNNFMTSIRLAYDAMVLKKNEK